MSISEQKMGIPIRNTQNNLKTSQSFRYHPDDRRKSEPAADRAGALLGLRLTPVIFSCTCPGSCHHEQSREQKNHLYQTHRHPLPFFFALHTKFLCSGKGPEKRSFPDSRARSHGTYPSDACKHARPSLLHAHFCLREHYIITPDPSLFFSII